MTERSQEIPRDLEMGCLNAVTHFRSSNMTIKRMQYARERGNGMTESVASLIYFKERISMAYCGLNRDRYSAPMSSLRQPHQHQISARQDEIVRVKVIYQVVWFRSLDS
jgi:hypothetical protein